MEVWIHPSLRIKALGLTPSSRIQLPGQFQSSLSPTLGGCLPFFLIAGTHQAIRLLLLSANTQDGIRTHTSFLNRVWAGRVYQFHHKGIKNRGCLTTSPLLNWMWLNHPPSYWFSAYLCRITKNLRISVSWEARPRVFRLQAILNC